MRREDRIARWEHEGGAWSDPPRTRRAGPDVRGIETEEADRCYGEAGVDRQRRAIDMALKGPARALGGKPRTIAAGAPLAAVLAAFCEADVSALAVVDSHGRLVGVIAPIAVVRALVAAPIPGALPTAGDLATPAQCRLRAEDSVGHVLAQAEVTGAAWLVPIVDAEDRPLALLGPGRILRFVLSVLRPRGAGCTLTPGPVASAREGG